MDFAGIKSVEGVPSVMLVTLMLGIYAFVSFFALLQGIAVGFAGLTYAARDESKLQERAAVADKIRCVNLYVSATIWISGAPLVPMHLSGAFTGRDPESPFTAVGIVIAIAWAVWEAVFRAKKDSAVADLSIAITDDSSLKEGLIGVIRFVPTLRRTIQKASIRQRVIL